MAGNSRWALVGWVAVLAGCSPPTVHVSHQVNSALPIPAHTSRAVVEPMQVRLGPADDYGPQAARLLVRELGRQTPWEVSLAPPEQPEDVPAPLDRPPDLVLSGRLYIHVQDEATTQPVAAFEPSGQAGPPEAQARLVRLVAVRQEVVVADGSGAVIGTLQAEHQHDSRHDRSTGGLWGLGRRDDPSAVRPADEVIPPLLESLAATLAGMAAPETIAVDIRLRDTPHPTGRQGLKAVRQGRLTQAREHFEAALAGAKDQPDLAFNLAAVEEALGMFDCALGHYLLAMEPRVIEGRPADDADSRDMDRQARDGADRLRRMLSYEMGR